ncbi:caveolin-1 [Caerostris extrusa]|uniref:Caveolin n=1 Tax=Caerostris extrusa TaxID=172846 RepID=A0AAV4MMZ4_CAEEX|nr:caveolin-1 [Caerostris extrusa]
MFRFSGESRVEVKRSLGFKRHYLFDVKRTIFGAYCLSKLRGMYIFRRHIFPEFERKCISLKENGWSNAFSMVEFDDVIAEPEGTYSVDCVWKSSNRLFTCSKNCCYKTLTLICGLPIAFISGCSFACLSFQHIWCISPALRQCRINCHMVRQYFTTVLDSCLGPCCSEMGLCLSRIRIEDTSSLPVK